ncbi:MAG: low specificity L-threonine aldolase [Rhodoferax sp.]|nr:low specificity L-threonine aldolase [Rhodoferax sp.]
MSLRTDPLAPIDLRSDFLARPDAAMNEAAAAARADARYFGLREDPWQRRLEARLAELTGQEDALVFPTCSMANTTALMLAAPPGSGVLTQPGAHVLVSEAHAGAALGGLALSAVDGRHDGGSDAMPALSAWRQALAGTVDAQRPAVRLCVLENTHNRSGGVPLTVAYTAAVVALARERGVALHLDGARLLYAARALGVAPRALCGGFDTVSVSLNKTLGAPVAAALAGPADRIERALTLRQRLGGGLRPTGTACAEALAGLDGLADLDQPLALARRLAAGLAQCPGLRVLAPDTLSNLVMVELAHDDAASGAVARMAGRGLLALAMDGRRIRFALYRGITPDQIERGLAIVRAAINPP